MIQNSPQAVRRREPRKSSHPDDLTQLGGVSIGGSMKKTTEDLFWEKVDKEEGMGCWTWTAYRNKKGYGRFALGRKSRGAHRVSWLLSFGPVPYGLCVLHSCDNTSCVNPAHLFLGTNADNVADMVSKGRNARGESHASSKLTEDDVRNILLSDTHAVELAAKYGVKKSCIYLVRRRINWRHLSAKEDA